MHSDNIRAFLNMFVGCTPEPALAPEALPPRDWMDLGEETGEEVDADDAAERPAQEEPAEAPTEPQPK